MKKLEKPQITNAKLWNKLTVDEQKRWIKLYNSFEKELNILSKTNNKIKAHNLAYDVIWDKY